MDHYSVVVMDAERYKQSMIHSLTKIFYGLQIKFMLIFRPRVLFDSINQLDWYKESMIQWVLNQNFDKNSKILEVGCATGTLTAYISETGHDPTGVDHSASMVALAQKKYHSIQFFVASVINLPFQQEQYDSVLAASLINIVVDKARAIDEMVRVCKRGGIVSVLVPSDEFNPLELQLLQQATATSGFSAAAMKAWHNLAPKMSTSEMLSLFQGAGLTKIVMNKHLKGMVISVSGVKV